MLKTYSPVQKLKFCLRLNLFVIGLCVAFFIGCAEPDALQFGPSDDFVVLGVQINTWARYVVFNALIVLIQQALLLTEEFALPYIDFTVYNFKCVTIADFTRLGMQLMTNGIYSSKEALKYIKMMILISRPDALLFTYLAEELLSIVTVYIILGEKTFPMDSEIINKPEQP